jgi:prevent-host-death family protein
MREIGAFEAKNTLGSLLDHVEQGEEIVITRHGRPVARLVPNTRRIDQETSLAASDRIRQRVSSLRLGAFDWSLLKSERDGDRP